MADRGTFGGGSGTWARRLATAFAFMLGYALWVATSGAQAASAAGDPAAGSASRVPKPVVAISAPGQCVEDTQFMLRNHMELLKHHRDQTVHQGVRTTRHSLANCVACHASKETGRVTGSKDAFCESCHRFAAVSLDCFECHSDRSPIGVATNAPPAGGVPR